MATQMLRQAPIQFEYQRNNRFKLEFPGELNIDAWLVQKVTIPSKKTNVVGIDYMNTKQFVHGKYEWSTGEFELVTPIGPSSTQKSMEWGRLFSESLTGRQGYAAGAVKDLTFTRLDPVGTGISKMVWYGCVIAEIKFGEADYSSDDVVRTTVTIQPQFCEWPY